MTQPVTLPSGKIIDQSTLEKHGHNEAIWGRTPSDPFTGLKFSDNRKPIAATALKVRIDKFLLDNCDAGEIKVLPRVLGSAFRNSRREFPVSSIVGSKVKRRIETVDEKLKRRKLQSHALPIASVRQSGSATSVKTSKSTETSVSSGNICDENYEEMLTTSVDNSLEFSIQRALFGLKRFCEPVDCEEKIVVNNCECCTNSIFYRLPCQHSICRKVLFSIRNNQCTICNATFSTSDPERIH